MKIVFILILSFFPLLVEGQQSTIFGKWSLQNHEEIDSISLQNGNIGFLYSQAMSLADRISYVKISKKYQIVFMPENKNGVRYYSRFKFTPDKRSILIELIGDEKEEYQIVQKCRNEIELINKYNNRIILLRK